MWKSIRQHQESIVLFLGTLVLFISGLSSQEVVSFDSRFYLFALEMMRHGVSWFPTTYLQPYPDYTSLSTLLIYGAARLFGGLDKLTAVLPSAMAAAMTVVMTYQIGLLYGKRYALQAVLLLLFTFTFIKSARAISLDMYPTLMTTVCFYLLHSAHTLRKPERLYWVYLFMMLGFLFRGPIGLVIPTGVVCLYYLLDRDYRRFFVTGCFSFGLLLAGTIALLLLANRMHGMAFMQDVFRMQVGGRIENTYSPFYFYFINSFSSYAISYCFAVATVAGVFFYRHKLVDYAYLVKLTGWVAVILIGMSIPGDKKVRYILPLAPALALLAAYPFSIVLRQSYFVWLRKVMVFLFLLTPTILLFATYLVAKHMAQVDFLANVPFTTLAVFYIGLQAVSLVVLLTLENGRRALPLLLLAWVGFFVAYLYIAEPLELMLDRARLFVSHVEQMRAKQGAALVFYREQPDSMPIKYLANMTKEDMPVFLHTKDELLVWRAPAIFITSKAYFAELPKKEARHFVVVDTGKIGHVEVVVFQRVDN